MAMNMPSKSVHFGYTWLRHQFDVTLFLEKKIFMFVVHMSSYFRSSLAGAATFLCSSLRRNYLSIKWFREIGR